MKVHADICFYGLLSASELYTAEGGIHIADTGNETSGTSDDSDKCKSFIQLHIQ